MKSFNLKLIIYDIIPFVAVCVLIFFFCKPFKNDQSQSSAQILFPIDSLATTNSGVATHNSFLISVLLERESTADQLLSSGTTDLTQIRNINLAIIGIILTLTYSDNRRKRIGEIIILTLLPFMLYNEVSREDELIRHNIKNQATHLAIQKILNSNHSMSPWYEIDYRETEKQLQIASEHSLMRKFSLASQLNISRIIFYMMPWILIYISATVKSRKKTIA